MKLKTKLSRSTISHLHNWGTIIKQDPNYNWTKCDDNLHNMLVLYSKQLTKTNNKLSSVMKQLGLSKTTQAKIKACIDNVEIKINIEKS